MREWEVSQLAIEKFLHLEMLLARLSQSAVLYTNLKVRVLHTEEKDCEPGSLLVQALESKHCICWHCEVHVQGKKSAPQLQETGTHLLFFILIRFLITWRGMHTMKMNSLISSGNISQEHTLKQCFLWVFHIQSSQFLKLTITANKFKIKQ